MRRLRLTGGSLGLWGLVTITILWLGFPALASISGPCSGSATINGVTYTPANDTAANPILLPENPGGTSIEYEGSISAANTNYLGAIGVVIGPVTVNVADWGLEENADDERSKGPANYVLGDELNQIVGLYQVTAFHDADGGSCDYTGMVRIEGAPMEHPVGQSAVALAVVSGAGLVAAGFGRKGNA